MARRIGTSAYMTAIFRMDEPSGNPLEIFNNFDVENFGSTPSAVSDPDVPFSWCRDFSITTPKSLRVVHTVETDEALQPSTVNGEFTMGFWFNMTVATSYTLLHKLAWPNGYVVRVIGGGLYVQISVGGGWAAWTGPVYFTAADHWYHAAWTWKEEGDLSFYYDGAYVGGSPSPAGSYTANSTDFYVGRNYGSSNPSYNGKMADLFVSKREFPRWEIANITGAVKDPQAGFEVVS